MDTEQLSLYQQQLDQINQALLVCSEIPEKEELLTLKANIEELLELTTGNTKNSNTLNHNELDNEFAAFMAEMEKAGALENKEPVKSPVEINLKDVEGKKCKAPHQHQWDNITYHNAMICSVVSNNNEEPMVRVLFINPTHEEMLPCPFYYNSDCKFSDEQCKFSHGEIVPYSRLQDYIEPDFECLKKGSMVLAKQKNNLWYRAQVQQLYEDRCIVKFENDSKEQDVNLEHVFPLHGDFKEDSDNEIDNLDDVNNQEDIINNSLMVTPAEQAMGDWEKYTKGMGSKLMLKMGYIVGTGLGKNASGRVNPVSAVIFPPGKSLDHCMNLREQAGGNKDLFSVEKKMKRLQRKQEIQSKKAYERAQKQQDVFSLINRAVKVTEEKDVLDGKDERNDIRKATNRNLSIKSVELDKNIKNTEKDLNILKSSLARRTDHSSDIYKKISEKIDQQQLELSSFKNQAQMIKSEQSLRDNKKKMTVF